jgi:hypothetical protein
MGYIYDIIIIGITDKTYPYANIPPALDEFKLNAQ